MEEEAKGKIPFLNTLVKREGMRVRSSVYRKQTNTNRYIQFESHHHRKILKGVMCCLKDRAYRLCIDHTKAKKLPHPVTVFNNNGSPRSLVNSVLHKPHKQLTQNKPSNNKVAKVLLLPYV